MGSISGVVTYLDGQPSTLSCVSAAIGGMPGRVTPPVRTDSQGRFTLTWDGECGAAAVYCDHREVARDVPSGTSTLHIVIQ